MSSYLCIKDKYSCQTKEEIYLPISKNDVLYIQQKYLDTGDFYISGNIEGIYSPACDDDLNKINLLSYLIQDSDCYSALEAVCEHSSYDLDEWLSIAYRAENIAFYYYEDSDYYYSNEEKFGRTLAIQNGLLDKLSETGGDIEDYFDFERYGRDMSYDYTLTEDGYMYDDGEIELNYTYEEILDYEGEDWMPVKDHFDISELSEFNHIELLEAMFEHK